MKKTVLWNWSNPLFSQKLFSPSPGIEPGWLQWKLFSKQHLIPLMLRFLRAGALFNGGWLMFERSWVRISAPYTGWTFFTLICWQNCNVCLERPKINEKEAGVGSSIKNISCTGHASPTFEENPVSAGY